ncbi:magnesium transporter NIPA-domain-containing protein, partial [Xylariales sp. PMI_506]
MLIALALNVQRYSHTQLHKRKAEAKERAKEALRRIQSGNRNGYGTTDNDTAETFGAEDGELPAPHPLSHSFQSGESSTTDTSHESSSYLKSPLWWLGQVLMTVGEMGNFLAYGFAPASIVSPLGVVALISNCVIAPIFFGEMFRARDFWGVLIAIAGAVVVVLSAKQEEMKLDPHNVWDAITTMEFEIYMAVSITLIVVLMWASPKYGNRTILIDLGLVGLFGAYTALSTKGVSSMLSSTLWRAFATPVTYVLVFILLATAVMQVRYVNKALQRFDSTQVIPIQFVIFTLSVIIGSAVLYRDFERTSAEQAMKFVGGCLLTFFGVFL